MTDIIKIHKKDEVHLKVDASPSILQELQEYFTFDVPGAKFHPLYRNKMWDGKVRLITPFTRELYIGLKDYLQKFAENNDYSFDQTAYIPIADIVTYEEVKEFCNSLVPTSNEKRIDYRDYQLDAIYQGIKEGRKLLLSPTGSGKSLIIYSLIRWHHLRNRKQLVIVPTTSLVEQMFTDFKDYSYENKWNTDEYCYKIYGGSEKTADHDVTISTWQSLQRLPKSFFEQFDCVYGDECHQYKAKSLSGIITKCIKTPYKIGTTGTLDGTQTHKLVLEGLFGSVYKVTTTKELMTNKQLAELRIYCITLSYDDNTRKLLSKADYQTEIDFLVTNSKRNTFIKNLALSRKGNTLVLFQYVEKHGKVLYEMIKEKGEESRKIFFIHGGTEAEQRESIRAITEKELDSIIVASYGTFSAGVNIKNLHNIIFASPSKSRIRNLQSIGRGLRISDTKTECNLYDIGDDLSWKRRKNFTLQHLVERVKIYTSESFNYKLIEVKLNE